MRNVGMIMFHLNYVGVMELEVSRSLISILKYCCEVFEVM